MANKSSTSLYETLDGINYNSGYSQASANTVASGVQDDIVGRIQNIPNGGVFDLNKAAANFAKTHNREIISDLSLSDRQDIYFALKREIWAPLYESSDETTFNLMKGYTGAYLYSQYEWFNPGEDFNAHELAVLQAGSAVYQLMDFIIGDDSIHEAFTDWWEQGVGLNIAYWEALGRIPDAVKGKHVSIQLRDAGISVAAGYDPITGELYVYAEQDSNLDSVDSDPEPNAEGYTTTTSGVVSISNGYGRLSVQSSQGSAYWETVCDGVWSNENNRIEGFLNNDSFTASYIEEENEFGNLEVVGYNVSASGDVVISHIRQGNEELLPSRYFTGVSFAGELRFDDGNYDQGNQEWAVTVSPGSEAPMPDF